jgi:acyl dehydratase
MSKRLKRYRRKNMTRALKVPAPIFTIEVSDLPGSFQRRRPMMPELGQIVRRSRTVTAGDIELFSQMTGDHNPLHYDSEAAARTTFGGIIVQGGVISGILNALVAQDLPGPGSVFLHTDWSFKAPVRPGDTITAEGEVIEVRRDKPIARLRTTISNQDGVIVLDGSALVYTVELNADG